MEEDMKERYERACIKKKLDPLVCVLNACETGMGVLNLSGNCLPVDVCKVLSRTLQGGHPFHEIDMSDCLVGDEGLTKMMNFLGQDTQLTCLILKGNAIRSQGTVALASALKRNTTLEKLSLEWNNVGVQEREIRQLCEALTVHPSLRCLDLRSNHIDHVGATNLASVLQLNSSLQELDLRWNNIGVLGGRKLLSALKGNASLVVLRVEGNSIPDDITEAIGASMSLRFTQQVMEAQHQTESKELSQQLHQMHSDAQEKVIEVLDALDSERTAFLQSSQISRCEIEDLKAHLEERDTTIARLEKTLLEVRDALGESLAKSEGLAADLEHSKKQALKEEMDYKEKIKTFEQKIDTVNDNLSSTSSLAKVREKEDEAKMHSLQLEVKVLQDKMAASLKHHNSVQQDLSTRITDLEAKQSKDQENHKKELAQALQSHQSQLSKVEEEQRARETALNKKLKKSEEDRVHTEEEVKGLKKKLASEKGKTSEEVDGLQQSLKLQTMKTSHLRDQLKELTTRYEGATEELCSTMSRHKAERAKLEEEVSTMQRQMKEKLSAHDSDRSEWSHYKKNHKDLLKELEEEKDILQKDVKHLKHSCENEKRKRSESEKHKEEEVASLTRQLEQQQQVLQKYQLEEKQRMSELRSALDNYIKRSPLT